MTAADSLPDRLQSDRCVLVVVDLQERFADLIYKMDEVLAATSRLVRFCQKMEIPTLVTEHYPRGLGRTLPQVKDLWPDFAAIEKVHFSCCGCEDFNSALTATGRDQIILCGIESHVCIYLTAADLRRQGRQVTVAADAVSSCAKSDLKRGLRAMAPLGVQILGTQMIMFEILHRAATGQFKAVADLLRN